MVTIIDWFVSDFTLPEVKKLRAKQAFAKVRNSTTINMQSSLLEVIVLAKLKSKKLGRIIEFIPKQNILLFMRRKIYK
jgi:glycerophosphoryl diester phosphodiesterase